MSGDSLKKKILRGALANSYKNVKVASLKPFSPKGKFSPNLFLLTEISGKEWLVKIKDKEYGNQEYTENFYSILKKNKFPAIYPARNGSKKFITRKHNLMIQVLPFMTEQPFDLDEKKMDIIRLFSSFYNILNSNAKFLAYLDAEIFEKSKSKFDKFVKEYGHLKKMRETFSDLDNLIKRTQTYLGMVDNLKCCHWNCWEENVLYSDGKLFLIDFDTFGLGSHRAEIIRVLTDFRNEGKFIQLQEITKGIENFNRILIPDLQFSADDMRNLDVFFFYNIALKVTRENISNILNPGVRKFYTDWKKSSRSK